MDTVNLSINTSQVPHANKLVWATGEWRKLHEITQQFEYSATMFENGERKNKLAIGVSLIIFDFDEDVTLKQGIEVFSSCKSLIVTTKSHQVDKNGVKADRFRVLVPLDYCIIDMTYYSKLMRVLTRYYKSDVACTDPARYFSPSPNQLVYYSDSEEIFDITRFDAMIDSSEVLQKHIKHSPKSEKQPITSTLQDRVELSSLLDVKVEYYQYGMRTLETLKDLIKKTNPSDQAIGCRCFLNPSHEDRNPSCFIYRNEHSVYAKCVSCQIDGIIYI